MDTDPLWQFSNSSLTPIVSHAATHQPAIVVHSLLGVHFCGFFKSYVWRRLPRTREEADSEHVASRCFRLGFSVITFTLDNLPNLLYA